MVASFIGAKAPREPKAAEAKDMVWHHCEAMQPQVPFFLRLRNKLTWWQRHASAQVVELIAQGVHATWPLPHHMEWGEQTHCEQEVADALKVLGEYHEVGAIKEVPFSGTKYLIPWFIIKRQDQQKEKVRLISDCRLLNNYFEPRTFKLDHLGNVFP